MSYVLLSVRYYIYTVKSNKEQYPRGYNQLFPWQQMA